MASTNGNSGSNQPTGVPSSSTFSFKAPFPVSAAPPASVSALKHRRVSLASPSSPRVVQPWSFRDEMGLDAQSSEAASSSSFADNKDGAVPEKKGKMRKIDTSLDDSPAPEKKARKKWTQEETMMLVNGCQIHGVGNWKTILQDPNLKFHDRTAVDLKDRFRTYFPDAYKKHYPNAKTHLSNKVRSTYPDGTSLFEKTRSKRRRPFTEAEDAALKAGYEKHGTTWATIVKDPIFQEQNRRSTDLRDRFRNAFPHLYQAAGYKPRNAAKKKVDGPVRAADDNLSQMSTAGPVRSRRRAQSSTGYLRGGTKSVPQSTACSEDEDSSAGEEDEAKSPFKKPAPPIPRENSSSSNLSFRSTKSPPSHADASTQASTSTAPILTPATPSTPAPTNDSYMETNDDMDLITIETESLNIPDFMPNDTHSDMETWSSGVNTPTHSSTAAWSTAGASPTSSHVSDFLMNPSAANASGNVSSASSPFIQRRNNILGNNMIGKSAWGQDWFSPNPRLEASSASSNSSSSYVDNGFLPASPFSFHPHLNHGVLDRYDLFPPSMPNDTFSDAGLGDSHFSDDHGGGSGAGGASTGGTGFKGYHSQIAGDLISGAGSRMQSFSMPLSLYGAHSFASSGNEILGLGLEGIPEDAGIHPMQLDEHTSSFSAIDELGLTGISLNDNLESSSTASGSHHGGDAMDDGTVDIGYALRSPDKHSLQLQQHAHQLPYHQHQHTPHRKEKSDPEELETSMLNDPFSLDDLVDMSNDLQHVTPPATPLMTQPRPLRRSSQGAILHNFNDGHGGGGHHARSISVPPSEARNAVGGVGMGNGGMVGVPMSMDDTGVGLHMHSHSYSHSSHPYGQHAASHTHSQSHPNSPPDMNNLGRGLQNLFGMHQHQHQQHESASSSSSSVNLLGTGQTQRLGRSSEPMRLTNSAGGSRPIPTTSISSPTLRHRGHSLQQQQAPRTPQPQPATLFPAQLMLSSTQATAPGSAVSSPSTPSHTQNSNHGSPMPHAQGNGNSNANNASSGTGQDPWRLSAAASWMSLSSITSSDFYNVPYLDMHYTFASSMNGASGAAANGSVSGMGGLMGLGSFDGSLHDPSEGRQGQALDLAQSAVLAASGVGSSGAGGGGLSLSSLGLNLAFGNHANGSGKATDSTPSPAGTVRMTNMMMPKQPQSPSDTFGSVAAALAAASAVGQGGNETSGSGAGPGGSGLDMSGTGTIRQSHFKSASSSNSGLGRSMSHHRGQSAVNPQDLMLRSENNKRKRASWDGGVA